MLCHACMQACKYYICRALQSSIFALRKGVSRLHLCISIRKINTLRSLRKARNAENCSSACSLHDQVAKAEAKDHDADFEPAVLMLRLEHVSRAALGNSGRGTARRGCGRSRTAGARA